MQRSRSSSRGAALARAILTSLALLCAFSPELEPAHAARGVALSAPNDALKTPAAPSSQGATGLDTTGDPALDYTLHCQGCHRAEGSATAGAVPVLRGSMARFLAVNGGREYLVRVPGVAQSTLDDAALARLLNWMLAHFDGEHVPADFEAYTAPEVGALRRTPLIEPLRVRAELLERSAAPLED